MYKVLICGSRNYKDKKAIRRVIYALPKGTTVIHGAARGADSIAGEIAKEVGFKVETYPADWKRYGLGAGPVRNKQMLDKGEPDIVIAFYSNKKKSRGTKNMVIQAQKEGVLTVEYDGDE